VAGASLPHLYINYSGWHKTNGHLRCALDCLVYVVLGLDKTFRRGGVTGCTFRPRMGVTAVRAGLPALAGVQRLSALSAGF
jgi:hypothetical protein